MMIKRIIATFLAALMILASFTIVINAAESEQQPEYEFNTSNSKPVSYDYYLTGKYTPTDENGNPLKDENGNDVVITVDTKEERLELMDLRLVKGDFRLYVDGYSGEVAVEQISTGEVLFTNPYDASSKNMSEDEKISALSQIIINYKDLSNETSVTLPYYSYKNAVKAGNIKSEGVSQLNVKYIKDGIRVEYSIGKLQARSLVPEVMEATRFEELIKNKIKEGTDAAIAKAEAEDNKKAADAARSEWRNIESYFRKITLEGKTEKIQADYLLKYPFLQKEVEGQKVNVDIYEFTSIGKLKETKKTEEIIKKYCPEFTFEDIDNQYLEFNYSPNDKTEALFKVALEYTLDERGLTVRLPANGIRFDESLFRLENIQILPYMGAGINPNKGYNFFPDGSGTLFSFEQLAATGKGNKFFGTIYGEDFGYYHIASEGPHNEVVRYPVFGISETEKDAVTGKERDRGFFAIIEEGEALMKLISDHTTKYNTVIMQANPRPSDLVKPSGATEAWTVVSERKYTGNIKIRYFMLSDEDVVAQKGGYTADYVGMAKCYRDYLIKNGTLTKLTDKDVKENLPLYIETFGSIETTKKFLSIPYQTNVALTSFADLKTMYEELSANGVDNVNFILTGYSKGGLTKDTIPYGLKWDSSVKKGYDFDELLADANGKFGVYPDFDFAFSGTNTLFDGLTLDDHAIKTIDGRYTSKREYSATRQTFVNYYEMAISPAYFSRFYEKLTGQYLKTNPQGISVSTLGSYLSSDFDEDEPYNREDSKQFTAESFEYFDKMYNKVITSGGNAFTWKYVDVITDISTDSSRYSLSAATVPFLGIVLHGYVETVSTPINMEGNIDYAMLRAIENGTAFKFMLSYDNTELLKEYYNTSVYYSIRYDIWLSELISRYDEINRALKDVQTSTIEKHEFIDGVRIPENNELTNDAEAELLAAIEKEKADAANSKEANRIKLQKLRNDIIKYYNEALTQDAYNGYVTVRDALNVALVAYNNAAVAKLMAEISLEVAQKAYDDAKALADAPESTEVEDAKLADAETKLKSAKTDSESAIQAYDEAKAKVVALYTDYLNKLDEVKFILEARAVCAKAMADISLLADTPMYADLDAQLKFVITKLDVVFDKNGAEINLDAKKFEDICSELLPEKEEENDNGTTIPDTESNAYNKYATPYATIVYEQYSNGKTFVLNFNDFDVKVKIDGAYYTVAAYGYIELK